MTCNPDYFVAFSFIMLVKSADDELHNKTDRNRSSQSCLYPIAESTLPFGGVAVCLSASCNSARVDTLGMAPFRVKISENDEPTWIVGITCANLGAIVVF